ncbi:tetratricopeptide repeat protein [Eisenbergiella sp.]
MGKYFSDVADQAIEDIYYCYDVKRAAAAIQPLTAAARAGDGDAAYLLSRCLSGPQYSWAYHPFHDDDEAVKQLIRQSVLQGSAIGVLGAMRCGMLTRELEESMPFASLRQAWELVCQKAQAGSLFCQNMIGNTYYFLDVVRIEGKDPGDFSATDGFSRYLQENTLKCIPWLEKAFRGGMGFAGGNLYNLYNDGEKGWLEPQPEKAREVARLGAELGYPDWQERYGTQLLKEAGREKEGLDLCRQAAEQGQLSAWYHVGNAYDEGKIVGKDLPYALECYEKGLGAPRPIGCANGAGALYFLGEGGVPQDYARARELLEQAHSMKNNWGNDMLAICYLFGYGCPKDPARARELLEETDYSTKLKNYALGVIYTEGLGVPEDIGRGVEYLQKAKNYAPAQEALLRFKKTLFGKWVRKAK